MISNSNLTSPFGSSLPNRAWSDVSRVYRYGFNGKEKDAEGMGGGSATYDYGFRIYNPNLGKFLSVDPLTGSYPWYTPYQFAGNKPVWAIDIDGLEEYFVHKFNLKNSKGNVFTYKFIYRYIDPDDREENVPENSYLCLESYFTNNNYKQAYDDYDPKVNKIYKYSKAIVKTFKTLCDYSGSSILNILKKKNGVDQFGAILIFVSPRIYLGNDEGNTKEELKAKIGNDEAILNVASVLINDNNAKVIITGSASKIATDIDKSKDKLSEDNNQELADQRANAGKEMLKEILINEYKITDETKLNKIMSRVSTKGVVQGNNNDKEEDAAKNRYTEFKVE